MDIAQNKRRTLWRILRPITTVLTIASVGFVGVWLYTHREELAQIQWAHQWPVLLLLIGMYGISFILEFIVWHSYLRAIKPIPWLVNLRLYAYSNLSRRLPGGFGYLFVRAVQYHAEGIDSVTTLYFSIQELVLLVITGIVIAIAALSTGIDASTLILVILLGVLVMFVFRPRLLAQLFKKLTFGRFEVLAQAPTASGRAVTGWILLYAVAWINGGIMLFLLIGGLANAAHVNLYQSVGFWSSSASVGLVSGLLPAGQLARDASLSIMLQNYMSLSLALVIAIAFRFVITIGDVVWSLILYGFATIIPKWYCQERS